MNENASLIHVGLTVSDIDRTIDFYKKFFGFTEEFRGVFSSEFIADAPTLYRQEEGVYSDFAFIKSPDGLVLELFQFSSNLKAEQPVWNIPGYHHIAFKVDSVVESYQWMVEEGVEFFFEPKFRGDPKDNLYWVFLKDPDGNMVELQD